MSIIRDMRPQPYPLACQTQTFGYYLIIGWTSEGRPVGVPNGVTGRDGDGPQVITDEIAEYYLPQPPRAEEG